MDDRLLPFSIWVQLKSRLRVIVPYDLESAIQESEGLIMMMRKKVKVNLGSSFEKTMTGRSPRRCIYQVSGNRSTGSRKDL